MSVGEEGEEVAGGVGGERKSRGGNSGGREGRGTGGEDVASDRVGPRRLRDEDVRVLLLACGLKRDRRRRSGQRIFVTEKGKLNAP